MALGTTIDAEAERESARAGEYDDMEITMATIASLTIDALASLVPAKCVWVPVGQPSALSYLCTPVVGLCTLFVSDFSTSPC